MPALRNPRHEAFCHAYRENGGNGRRAYLAAGYNARLPRNSRSVPVDAAASRLLRHVKVNERLQELAAMTTKRHEITVDTLITDLEDDRQLARTEGQASAAVQATMAKARLLGLIIDRKESGAPGDFAGLQTADEVIALVRNELGEEAAKALARLMNAAPEATHQAPDTVN
jgi:phage terminase small subunit